VASDGFHYRGTEYLAVQSVGADARTASWLGCTGKPIGYKAAAQCSRLMANPVRRPRVRCRGRRQSFEAAKVAPGGQPSAPRRAALSRWHSGSPRRSVRRAASSGTIGSMHLLPGFRIARLNERVVHSNHSFPTCDNYSLVKPTTTIHQNRSSYRPSAGGLQQAVSLWL